MPALRSYIVHFRLFGEAGHICQANRPSLRHGVQCQMEQPRVAFDKPGGAVLPAFNPSL